MNKIIKTSIAFVALAGSITFASLKISDQETQVIQVVAKDKTISDAQFVEVNNFLFSGKGFLLEFDYDLPSTTKTMAFNFMNFGNSWHRLTENFTMTFKSDGTITTNIGHVFNLNGNHYFESMFSELAGHLNKSTGEVADGTETLDGMYIRDDTVNFIPKNAELISTGMNAYPVSEIRNDVVPGLTFKAYTPEVVEGAKYGMLIVPSSYLKDAEGNYKKYFKDNNINFVDLECNPVLLQNNDQIYKTFGSGYSFKGSLINIKEDNYQIPFVAIPYYELNGNVTYSNLIKSTKVSYYDKCVEFKKSSSYSGAFDLVKDEVNNIIYKCEHHATKVQLGADVKAYFAYNTEKIFKAAALPGELITENVMYSAKNETERGQVIINVPSSFSKKYFASFEPFVHVDDANARIGTENISIEQQLYQNVKTNWSVGASQPTGWYPDGKVEYDLPLGYVPDALLPFGVAFDANENILTGQNGPNNGLQYTIKVPEDAKEGTYKSKLIIRVSGEGTLALPVTLNVFDFKLPEENKNKYVIKVHNAETKALYGTDSLDSVYHTSAYNMLKERGISGGVVPASYWQTGDTANFINKTKELAADPRVASYWLPMSQEEVSLTARVKKNSYSYEDIVLDNLVLFRVTDKLYNNTTVLPGMKTMFRELIKASTNELDLLKKASIYCPQTDEPGKNKNKQIQNILCENVVKRIIDELLVEENLFTGKDKVKESFKKIPYIVTSYPRDYLKDANITAITPKSGYEEKCAACYCESAEQVKYHHLTCYCPTYESYQYDIGNVANMGYSFLMEKMNDPEYTLWWYSCIQPVSPYPCFFVNANLIQKRANKWTEYSMGIQGELYYMCNRTQEYHNEVSTPCTEEEILAGGATYEGTYGDGSLIYPVHFKYGKYDSSLYWLSSLRIDNVAESIDDYNYIAYADELCSSESEHNALMSLINSVHNGPGRNTKDHELLFNKRIELGNFIVNLLK